MNAPGNLERAPSPGPSELRALAGLFLKLGFTAFGGPAAHVALMQDEVVRRRKWLTEEEFLDLLGATHLIPGPNSTEMAIHIGLRRAGWPGLVVAGLSFIVPAVLIVLVCAWGYVRYGQLPELAGTLSGIKPVIIAVVMLALWSLGKSAIKTRFLGAVMLLVIGLNLFGVNELVLLFVAGALTAAASSFSRRRGALPALGLPVLLLAAGSPGLTGAGAAGYGLWPLFLFFVKVGSVLYGSGYVLLAFLQSGLVERLGWLSEAQLLDAVAVGQFTPGPLFTTATFIGYVLGGTPAALAATAGIFLPAFFFVAVSGPLIPRIRRSPTAGAFLDGVNVASLALMAVVTWQLAGAALTDWLAVTLLVVAGALLWRFQVNSVWLVLGGGLIGLARSMGVF